MKQVLINLLAVLAAVLAPAKAMMLTAFTLIIADLILGLLAAYKEGTPITSAGLRRTVTKLFVYESAIILAFLTETYLTGQVMPLASIVSSMIGLVELTSCLENLNTVSGGQMLKKILKKLGSVNK